MTSLLHIIPALSAGATGALFSAIWEGSILALCVFLVMRLLPGLSAAARSVIWLNIFILLGVLHFVPAFTSGTREAAAHPSPLHLDLRWSLGIAAVWLLLSSWRAVQLIIGAVHLKRLAQRAVPVAVPPAVAELLRDGRGRTAELCTSDEVARPSVLGFFRPRILIPPAVAEGLSTAELQQVLLHEMEHLRRADDWTNLMQKLALVLFPLNPVLIWVERQLCAERELACDDRVIESRAGRKAYALCLAHLAEYSILSRSFSLVLGAWERRPELVRRVQRILSQPARVMGRRAAVATTGALVSGALGITFALAHSPQLVSFAPVASPVQIRPVESVSFNEMTRQLGGTPQLVKASLPKPQIAKVKAKPQRSTRKLCTAMVRRTVQPCCATPEAIRLAPLQPMQEVEERRTLVLMTRWTELETPSRVFVTLDRATEMPTVLIPAKFAAVPTPGGWLIIKI